MKLHQPLLNTYKSITNNLPPVFLTSANQDWMLGQNRKMNQLLTKQHVKHEYKEYGDQAHPLPHDFQIFTFKQKVSQDCIQTAIKFLKSLL